MTKERIQIGVIGAGMIAQVMHLPHLLEMEEQFEVTALCDISVGTAMAVARKFGIKNVTSDYRDLLEKFDIDAVLVLTRDHAKPAIAAACAGKHVFIEKPMCNNLEEADELVDAVRSNNVVGMVAYHKRYDPGYRLGRQLIQALETPYLVRLHDVIGPNEFFLEHYDIIRIDDIDPVKKRDMDAEHMDSLRVAIGEQPPAVIRAYELMLGLSTHDVTILHGALGLPSHVISTEIWADGTAYAAIMAYANGLRCVFDTGFIRGLRKFDETLTVYSSNKVVEIAFPSPFLKNAPTMVETWEMNGDVYVESHHLASYEEAFKEELRHFHACIVEGQTPETPVTEGREDIALLIQMIQAYRP
ncbi:MAG: oxidoreductase [Patescibacteria group bacterium]|nr:MAG: oxidoreductase [Patescibacteria group bacterium]